MPAPQEAKSPIAEPAAIGLYAVCVLLAGLTAVTGPFLRRYSGAPYVASAPAARAAIRSFLHTCRYSTRGSNAPRFIDLGAGSSELVLDAARAGFQGRRVELNRWLVLRSRLRAYGLPAEQRKRVEFKKQDLWTNQMREEDVVAVFGVPDMMERIRVMVENQCKDECIVCCNTFPIPGWTAMRKTGVVWFYNVGQQRRRDIAGSVVGG